MMNSVLYDESRTSGAFDSPTQNTTSVCIAWVECLPVTLMSMCVMCYVWFVVVGEVIAVATPTTLEEGEGYTH